MNPNPNLTLTLCQAWLSRLFVSAEQSAAIFTWTIKQVEAEVRQREHLTYRARAISQPLARCRPAGASYQPAL